MRLDWLRGRRGVVAVAVVALAARLGPIPVVLRLLPLSVERGFADDGWSYYLPLARTLVESGEYAVRPGIPCISHVPLYPIALAGALALADDSPLSITVFQACLGAALLVLLFVWTRRLFGPLAAGVAVVLATALPDVAVYSYLNLAENLSLILFLVVLLSMQSAVEARSYRWWAVVGLVLGLAVLTREFFVTLLAPLAGWIWLTLRRRGALPRIALIVLACLLVLVPWTVRNAIRIGEFVPLTEKGGVNLYVGTLVGKYHPSDARRMWRIEDPHQQEVDRRLKEDLARAHGPAERDRLFRRAAWANIRNDPWGQLSYLPRKARFFWEPNVGVRHAERLGHGGLLLAGEILYFFCLLTAAVSPLVPGHRSQAHLLVWILITWTFGFHLLVGEAESRYHVTILPLILALAGRTLAWSVEGLRRGPA